MMRKSNFNVKTKVILYFQVWMFAQVFNVPHQLTWSAHQLTWSAKPILCLRNAHILDYKLLFHVLHQLVMVFG